MTEPSVQPPPTQNSWSHALSYPLAAIGALVGAALGTLIFKWGISTGFYAIPVIGLLAGWGAAIFSRRASWPIGILAGLITAVVAVWAEWKFVGAFRADDSFTFFVKNITQLPPFKLLFHAVGIAAAIWLGARK